MRHISAKEVRENLSMAEAIKAMEIAFQDLSSGKAIVPDRLPMHIGTASEYLFMPAYYPSGGITTIKSVSINATNTERGLPFIHAVLLVFDHDSGKPIATIDGGEVTAIRTAAASGLATKLFANPASRIAAIFGTGVQARSHIEAITAVRSLDKVLVFGSSSEKARIFCNDFQTQFDVDLEPGNEAIDLESADIICTTTTSNTPVFQHKYVKQGAHINAVGVYKPDCREIPSQTVIDSEVFIDQFEGAMAEAGDLLIPLSRGEIDKDHFRREIGKVLSGEIAYQWSANKTTLFKSVGNAIQDAAAAHVL